MGKNPFDFTYANFQYKYFGLFWVNEKKKEVIGHEWLKTRQSVTFSDSQGDYSSSSETNETL